MRWLITGGSGFIGTNLAGHLAQILHIGVKVKGLDHVEPVGTDGVAIIVRAISIPEIPTFRREGLLAKRRHRKHASRHNGQPKRIHLYHDLFQVSAASDTRPT